jgi:hypothetical protein
MAHSTWLSADYRIPAYTLTSNAPAACANPLPSGGPAALQHSRPAATTQRRQRAVRQARRVQMLSQDLRRLRTPPHPIKVTSRHRRAPRFIPRRHDRARHVRPAAAHPGPVISIGPNVTRTKHHAPQVRGNCARSTVRAAMFTLARMRHHRRAARPNEAGAVEWHVRHKRGIWYSACSFTQAGAQGIGSSLVRGLLDGTSRSWPGARIVAN